MPPRLAAAPDPPSRPAGSRLDPTHAFERVSRRMGLKPPAPTFQVEYRPFAGLRSTISLRNNHVRVCISDVLRPAPPIVLEALAEILLAQVFRRRASREARECYLAYVFRPAVRRRIDGARRQRGFKRWLPAQGQCYNLEEIFRTLNRRFFAGTLPQPQLGWSLRRSQTVLGHYDSAHATIILSRALDSAKAPRYLIEYLVFHEMLHIRFPVERQGHRRVLHSQEFRKEEMKFPRFAEALRKLKHFTC